MGDKLGPVDIEFFLKNINIKEESQRMRNEIKGIGVAAQDTNKLLATLGAGVGAYLSFQGISGFGRELINVRGEFQQLGIAFETMLGSKEKADKLMAQTVDLAARTPYSLREVAQVEKGLIAFGEDASTVADTVTRLGNIASGTGANIGELGQAYGKVMSKGKMQAEELNQFTERGVPIVKELAKMYGVATGEVYKMVEQGKVGFPELQKVIQNVTNEGGLFYNLMEKQSKSLTGMVSNLGDAWDKMLNSIGQSNEGILAGGISGLTNIVNNYQEVLNILKVLVATYGAYKAVLIAVSVAQRISAAATFTQEYIKMGRALGFATANQIAFNKATLANPYAIAAAAIAALVTSLYLFNRSATDAEKAQQKINDIQAKAADGSATEEAKIKVLIATIQSETTTRLEKNKAVQELNGLSPELLGNLTAENIGTQQATEAINNYIKSVRKKIEVQELERELGESISRQQKAERGDVDPTMWQEFTAQTKLMFGMFSSLKNQVNQTRQEAVNAELFLQKKLNEQLQKVLSDGSTPGDSLDPKVKPRTVQIIDAEIAALKKQQTELATTRKAWEEYNNKIASLEKERDLITGVKKDDKGKTKEERIDKKNQDELLARTASFNEKKLLLDFKYQLEKKKLAGKDSNIAELDKQYQEELDALVAANFKKSESYRWVYDNLAKMGRNALNEYIARLRKEINAFKGNEEIKLELTKKLAEAEEKLNTFIPDKLKDAAGVLQEMAGLAGEFNRELAEALTSIAGIASGLSTAMEGFATGNILQGITGSVSVLTNIVKLFNGKVKGNGSDQLEKWIAKLVRVIQLQENALSLLSSKDQVNAYTAMLKTLEGQMGEVDKRMRSLYTGFQLALKAGVKDVPQSLKSYINKNFEDLTQEDWNKILSNTGGDIGKQLDAVYQQWLKIQQTQQEYINAQNELVTGSTYDSIVGSIVDGFADGLDSAADFADNFEQLMRTAMLKALAVNYLDDQIQGWYDLFASLMKDGTLSEEDKAKLKAAWDAIIANASVAADAMEGVAGMSISNEKGSENSMAGAIKGIQEDTASLIAGQMNAMRLLQIEGIQIHKSSLLHLAEINNNTYQLFAMKDLLNDIKTAVKGGSFNDARANGR